MLWGPPPQKCILQPCPGKLWKVHHRPHLEPQDKQQQRFISTDKAVLPSEQCEVLTAAENFVMTMPGATQFTLIFSEAKSLAAALHRPSSAVLLTE